LEVEVFSGEGTMERSFSVSIVSSNFVVVVVVVELEVVFGRAITGSVIPKSLEALNYELEKTVERGQWREEIVLPVSWSWTTLLTGAVEDDSFNSEYNINKKSKEGEKRI
jgi:hypothetical protein